MNAGRTPGISVVLDSSALLALVFGEPGREIVNEYVQRGAAISTVNLAEVISRLTREGMTDDEIRAAVIPLTLSIEELSADSAWHAGLMTRESNHLGLSLGDRCCLAVAAELGLPALTADRAWLSLNIGVEVVLCR